MRTKLDAVLHEVNQVLLGKEPQVRLALTCLLARGHLLIEDLPGMGKTTLSQALARVLGLSYQRIQFTSDLLPGDILGTSVFDKDSGQFVFHPGPIFAELVLADEINRATPKSQSALLEAMEEGQVTVDGVTRPVPRPFAVIATQNPVGASGTQLLPDSQMDRFMVRLSIGYPNPKDEVELLRRKQGGNPLEGVDRVLGEGGLLTLQRKVDAVHMADEMLGYVVALVGATRSHPLVEQGASPRASLAVTAMAKAAAYLRGRDYVIADDIRLIFPDTVEHRLILSPKAGEKSHPARDILRMVEPPRVK